MESFGDELRRLRRAAGLSQPQLATLVPISQTSLSRYENGRQSPDPGTVDRLEEILETNGVLRALAGELPARARGAAPDDRDRLSFVAKHPRSVDERALAALSRVLAESRLMEDQFGPHLVLEPACGYLRVVERLALDARGALRPRVVDVAAQWAQFAGWLHAATDQRVRAARWFDRVLEWSAESGNATLHANALSYKGHLAWMAGNVGPMVGLSQAAQRNRDVHVSQRAFDAMQEARGHAMAGDVLDADRALGVATERVERISDAAELPPWSYYYDLSFWTLQRGLIYRYLPERREQAAQLLQAGLAALPVEQQAAEWLGDYHRALAFVLT
jgi:transcriptional regulator with XRE-family HTH domain